VTGKCNIGSGDVPSLLAINESLPGILIREKDRIIAEMKYTMQPTEWRGEAVGSEGGGTPLIHR